MKDFAERMARDAAEAMSEASRSPAAPSAGRPPEWAFDLAELCIAANQDGGRDHLARAIDAGLHRLADTTDAVSVVATGMGWLGGGVGALERTMAELIAGAQREIILTAYSITPGSERVWDEIARALATGVRCTIVVDRLGEQHADIRTMLSRLASAYPQTLKVFDFSCDDAHGGLHAKVLVVDRVAAMVGSANLSHRGLVGAHELAIVVRGPAADIVAEQVDRLLRSADARPLT